MTVLIAKQNESLVNTLAESPLTFKPCTKNTSKFELTNTKLERLFDTAKEQGYNPFALFNF